MSAGMDNRGLGSVWGWQMLLDWVQSAVLQVLGGCKTTADVEARMIEDVISVVMVL